MGTRSLVLGVMDRSAGVCVCVSGRVFGAPCRRPFNHGREDDLRADREAVLTADIRPGPALQCASDDLRADREVVWTADPRAGSVLQLASDDPRADREVVLTAANRTGSALQRASDDLGADRELL